MNNFFMHQALEEAQKARQKNEVPIGAVIVCENQVIARAFNTCEQQKNPLVHAEMVVIQNAAQFKNNWRLNDCDLYVTLEPCPMCLGALFQARIRALYFGACDDKRIANPVFPSLKSVTSLNDNNHNLLIQGGILEQECATLLKDFFKEKRK